MTELIGYKSEFEALINNYTSNNLHSSIILHGPKGIGKYYFIKTFIKHVFKLKFNDNNITHHINLFNKNTHPNVKIIERNIDQKTKKLRTNISIDQIRILKKFINESSTIKNLSKFVIIDSADDLNINSASSFLKTLEEPKKNTFIFLISHQLSSLMPTIRSRCLKIKFKTHSYDNFKEILRNVIEEISEDEIKFYFDITYGSPGNAILLWNNNILDILNDTLNSLNSKIIHNNSINLANTISKFDNDQFKSYLSILKTILITLNKLKISDYDSTNYVSNYFNLLKNLSKTISNKNIIDRFDFLTNNESDLFTYNLDKKLFMLKFLTT